ncbi:sacsin N-terminal ATP-binding-like domain-containing protein [Eoetvoesiella caeni]
MTGFTTDYVNQIASNLRDRYKSGFPILKELVQNADDAGANCLAFGFHAGHSVAADHMLLKGPALWVLNDGRFKESDCRAIRSFGLNAKAGDSGTIGKFGLGMKSVFHLCESFFYLASHEGELSHDFLNPWRAEDYDSSEMHQQWETVTDQDLDCLEAVARAQPEASSGSDWFLLWVPLRLHSHVPRSGEHPMAAIIERYPGENPGADLDFFSDPDTDQRIGGLLPLLRNLKQVRFAGAEVREPFMVSLESHPSDQRLDHETDDVQISGTVRDDRPRSEHMHFLVRQRVPGVISPFGTLRAAKTWPTSMVITELGTREPRPDKAVAEAAVMFAHADKRAGRLNLQWAVFLPAEEQRFSYEALIPGSSREYRIVLHGQFFVDAGRRGIADMDALDKPCEALSESPAQHVVLRQWNQSLAQQAVLPEFLPGLSEYVKSAGLRDDEIVSLTRAITQCSSAGDAESRVAFFPTFQQFICKRFAWIRRLSKTGSCWELVEPAIEPVLSLPAPPLRDAERPWRALPGLAALNGYAFSDAIAPNLLIDRATWETDLLLRALKGTEPQILKSETDLDYLASFLEMEADRCVRTGDIQDALVALLRTSLQTVRLVDVRQNRKIFKRIVQLLPDRVFAFGPQDHTAKGAIPEALYRTLLNASTRVLPVPGDLAPDRVTAIPSNADLCAWLDAMMRHDVSGPHSGAVTKTQLLNATERVIKAAGDEAKQLLLLRQRGRLKVLRAYKGEDGETEGVSLMELTETHSRGWLFKVTDPNRPLGLVQILARALPGVRVFVVGSAVASYVNGLSEDGFDKIPRSEDAEALLRSAGIQSTPPLLGDTSQRADLLALVATIKLEDPIVIRGVRYLLHGSTDHYLGSDVLWKDPIGQNSPWVRLWRMVDDAPWRVLADSLCRSIPDKCAQPLKLQAVDEASVLNRLRVCNDFDRVDATEFTSDEIDLLLGRVVEEKTWLRLPLHQDFSGGRSAIHDDCFLGRDPDLPDGLAHAIRFIEPSSDPDHLRQQKRFLRQWNAAAAALVVIKAASPVRHWRYLMDLLDAHPLFAGQTQQTWYETAWLPLENGNGIALNSLIRINNLEAEIRDLARRCGYAYAGPDDLSVELRDHPAFPSLVTQICSGEEALPVLGQLMSEASLSIGWSARSGYRDLQQLMSTLVSINLLPAWGILERATVATSIDAVEKHLIPEITKQLPAEICQGILNQIPELGLGAPVREVFGIYLREWRASAPESELRKALSELRLLSKVGTWVPAAELVAGVQGVMPELAVDDELFDSLCGIAVDNRTTPIFQPTEMPAEDSGNAQEQLLQSVQDYFEPLVSSSVKPAAGAVIGLLGERVASLAKSWLTPIAYDDYLAKLGWQDPGHEEGFDRRVKWMGNKTLVQALSTLSIRLTVLTGNHMSAKSLTGKSMQVQIAPIDEIQTLFVMTDRWQGFSCRVHMRPTTVLLDKEPQLQRDILMRTGESLLKDLYNQQHANLSELFALADEADQVTLDVARGLILEGLPQSLRSLPGVRKNEKLALALSSLDAARRGAASAKRAGHSNAGTAASLESALADLATLVESDEEVQGAVLAGIQARVTHNQYEIASIPFEIFQNADDAVVEMQQLQRADGRPEFDAEAIGRFVLQSSGKTIRFAHWGRPINYAGRTLSYKPEFANDLELMLILGASVKDEGDGVTGKFGLGFKSVLLASRTPRVWSGDLCFDVVAGCLPRKWKASPATKQFQRAMQTSSQRALRGTLIELPLDAQIAASEVTERFAGLVGLLPVFARKLRCVVVGEHTHTWQPQILQLGNGRKIETGPVAIPVEGGQVHSGILHFKTNSGSIVLRMGAGGVEEFDRKAQPAVPAIWVTAPTRGTPARGVLLNAPFQIDTGRATLALGKAATQINETLTRTLADEVSPVLIDLQTESQSNWPALATKLGCTQSASAASFWYCLWETLLGEPPELDPAMDVRLLDTFACIVIRNVAGRTGQIPNGLKGDNAALAEVKSFCLSVNLSFLANVVPALVRWELFVDKYPVKKWCADQVRGWLLRSGLAEDESIPSLGLAQVVGVFKCGHVPPTEVANLVEILLLWPSNLGEPNRWRAEMASLFLRSRAGTWAPAKTLIRGFDTDDQLLGRFAPDKSVLHPDYAADSKEYRTFELYLPARSDDPSMLAGWCMSATGDHPQAAAATWLARNIYGRTIELLRARCHQGGWLFELTEDSLVLSGLSTEEKRLLLTKLGLTSSDQEDFPDLSPSLDLASIHGWWSEKGTKWLAEFDRKFWPESVDRNALREEGPHNRTAWMTLFSLGLFRRYGRVTDQQHRGFLDFLSSKGWWKTICEIHPDVGADAWMDILHAYGEGQQTDTLFELWMDSFPRLYRIAHWLDTYVHLFQTLDHRNSKLAEFLLSPASDPSLSGSGIEAPTLSGMLRLGQHLVIRELLRLEILTSDVARALAFAPRSAVLDLMARLGHADLRSSTDIYEALVSELGDEAALFSGAYDIPLQLIATNAVARREAELWAECGSFVESNEDVEQEGQL